MHIVSYNVNGIRAAINKNFVDWLELCSPDIICLQEIKAELGSFDSNIFAQKGYSVNWHSAEKKGYSGVAILSKNQAEQTLIGMDIPIIDVEGRVLECQYKNFSVICVYVPSGSNVNRLEYKFQFMDSFKNYIAKKLIQQPNLIICGDYNICHQAIDIHDPIRNKNVSGFLPQERLWLSEFLELGFIDSFRYINKTPHNYSWWSYRANARANNKGWRLDYCLVSLALQNKIKNAGILAEVSHSDHCPVYVELISD